MAILGIFGVIFAMAVPVGIVALIIVAAVKKDKGLGHKSFASVVRIIFSYTFVITSLFTIVIGSIVAVNSMLNYYLPDPESTQNYNDYSEYQGNDNSSNKQSVAFYNEYNQKVALENKRKDSLREATTSTALVVVSVPIFIYFSILIKKHKEE